MRDSEIKAHILEMIGKAINAAIWGDIKRCQDILYIMKFGK